MKKNKLVFGVGINDAEYTIKKNAVSYENGKKKQKLVWVCPFYRKWAHMLERCYSEKQSTNNPTYKGCSVCEEWLTFSNFKAWMEQQDWEDKHLDKDILFPGNKIYSPETCVFIDAKVNTFLIESDASRGQYMVGVCWHKRCKKFRARCNDGEGKLKHIGLFDTELEAHQAWLAFKLKVAKELAAEQSDPRIAKALIERYGTDNVRTPTLEMCLNESVSWKVRTIQEMLKERD